MAKATDPFKAFVSTFKEDDKAKRTLSNALKAIIDGYCASDEFDEYLKTHAPNMQQYINQDRDGRTLFRASAVGKCVQLQAFNAAAKRTIPTTVKFPPTATPPEQGVVVARHLQRTVVNRPARQWRALFNGTLAHVRWHMIFDALHEKGLVTTIYAEDYRVYPMLELDGSIDRCIEFDYDGKRPRCVVDFKTIKSEYWDKLVEPQVDHRKAQHAYDLFGYEANYWLMLYENKNTQELKIYDRHYDVLITEEIQRDLRNARQWVEELWHNREFTVHLPLETSWCNTCEWNEECAKIHPEREDLARAF